MKLAVHAAAFAAVSIVAFGVAPATAQDKPTLEQTYKDIKSVYGVTPEYMKVYPKQGIAAAWALTKALEVEPGALDPKIKSLINVAVAAQIPAVTASGSTASSPVNWGRPTQRSQKPWPRQA